MIVGLPQEQYFIGKGIDSEAGIQGFKGLPTFFYVTSHGRGGKGDSRSFIPVTGTSGLAHLVVSINSCLWDRRW